MAYIQTHTQRLCTGESCVIVRQGLVKDRAHSRGHTLLEFMAPKARGDTIQLSPPPTAQDPRTPALLLDEFKLDFHEGVKP